MAKLLSGHRIPRVGWPTSVLPPPGTRALARERGGAVTVTVTDRRAIATVRLDLQSRESAISASGADERARSRLRRLALAFIADRNAYDRRTGSKLSSVLPAFDEHDSATWTDMQLFADVTNSDWYPAEPLDRSTDGWAPFFAAAHRFNDRFESPDAAATAPHPTQPRGVQPSADPATPAPSTPAAE